MHDHLSFCEKGQKIWAAILPMRIEIELETESSEFLCESCKVLDSADIL